MQKTTTSCSEARAHFIENTERISKEEYCGSARAGFSFYEMQKNFLEACAKKKFNNPIVLFESAIWCALRNFGDDDITQMIDLFSSDIQEQYKDKTGEELFLLAVSPFREKDQVLNIFFAAVKKDYFEAKQYLSKTSAYSWLKWTKRESKGLVELVERDNSLGLHKIPGIELEMGGDPIFIGANNKNPYAAVLLLLDIEERLKTRASPALLSAKQITMEFFMGCSSFMISMPRTTLDFILSSTQAQKVPQK